eukprot:TRINITY_DN3519_c0_g1_i2.p1 TRINITY_DN3519_c0_g1~~TRINITY_DN3519_c0_g1_i2.p1  ORF type:complete len:375 (+),score=59.58 TRINITY_DN3519_c0_g1_i2:133-1257(+)
MELASMESLWHEGDVRENYLLGEEIGRGRFGVVRSCQDVMTGEVYALKSISKTALKSWDGVREMLVEVEALRRLQGSPHVVELIELYYDRQELHIVMENCRGGDLLGFLMRQRFLPEYEALSIFRQIAEALAFCHQHGIVHRDVKPENILLTGSSQSGLKAKMADFGLAWVLPSSSSYPAEAFKASPAGRVGSRMYMAPEVVKGESHGPACDVWSLGVSLYAAVSGKMPFWGDSEADIQFAICMKEVEFEGEVWGSVSRELKQLLQLMLMKNPSCRISMAGILCHSWMLKPKQPPAVVSPECWSLWTPEKFKAVADLRDFDSPLLHPDSSPSRPSGPTKLSFPPTFSRLHSPCSRTSSPTSIQTPISPLLLPAF